MERSRPVLIAIAIGSAVYFLIAAFKNPRGDFINHYKFGLRFLSGEFLYDQGLNIPYPPFWAMLFAPFSLLPPKIAMPLFVVIGLAALVMLLRTLRNLTAGKLPGLGARFWVVTAVLVILSRFVLRDLADGGENILINALAWGGIYFFVKRRTLPGGALLGLAIALKCTPLLFAGYFVLKRQWAAAISTLTFAALFFVSPMLVQGPGWYGRNVSEWKRNLLLGISQEDPSIGVLGPDELGNKSLRPMLARYLMQLPAGRPGRFGGVAYIDFLRLPPQTANLIIKLVTLVSGVVIVWLFIRSPADVNASNFLWECAIINILMLLFSPITWGEHCVSLIPVLYLIGLRLTSGKDFPLWTKRVMAVVVFVLIIVNRSIIGFWLSELAESYHVITFCILALCAVAFAFWNEQRRAASTIAAPSQA